MFSGVDRMALAEDLNAEVVKILRESWTPREGRHVPDTPDIKLGNDAVKLTGTVLYADLADSTGLVEAHPPKFAAEVYKTYLACACRIITAEGGVITSFDGDRVMAVYIGDSKNTAALRTALKINWAVLEVVNPRIREVYPHTPKDFAVRQAVGIDTSDLFVARTGIRGSNDLVWVGTAANLAAKLCSLREGGFASWCTSAVFGGAHDSAKTSGGRSMWEAMPWPGRPTTTVYRSGWTWKP
jgi:class 3 adenylate cyclase